MVNFFQIIKTEWLQSERRIPHYQEKRSAEDYRRKFFHIKVKVKYILAPRVGDYWILPLRSGFIMNKKIGGKPDMKLRFLEDG